MKKHKNQTDEIILFGIEVLGAMASIGGASVVGGALGNMNLGRASGLGKLFRPLGIAALSMAGGIAASNAIKQNATNGYKTAKRISKMITPEEEDEEDEEVEIVEDTE